MLKKQHPDFNLRVDPNFWLVFHCTHAKEAGLLLYVGNSVAYTEAYSGFPEVNYNATTSEQLSSNVTDVIHSHLELFLPRRTQTGQERVTEDTGTQDFKNTDQGALLKIQL